MKTQVRFLKMLSAFLLLFSSVWSWGQVSNGLLDFGNPADNTTATTANTGFGGVRVGAGGGGFFISNPGQTIGSGGELKGIATGTGSINSVGITSSEYGTSANLFTISFDLFFSGGDSGIWYFFPEMEIVLE